MESIKDEGLDVTGLLREIDLAEAKCEQALKRLRKQRLLLTGEDQIEFTVSTIHKDRIGWILDLISRVDKSRGYNALKNEWRASAIATTNGWFGTIKAVGSKERLLSVVHKIAKQGGTVTVDESANIEIPSPHKWWDYELEAILDAERETVKSKENESQI